MVSDRRVLVIGAHSADFVWRAGGAIAVATAAGGTARVIALSYGERGESGELWKEDPDRSLEDVKQIRHGEASAPRLISAPTSSRWTSVTIRLRSIRKR